MSEIFFSGVTLQVYNLVRQDYQLQFICRPSNQNQKVLFKVGTFYNNTTESKL
jgi:hypothetical protein